MILYKNKRSRELIKTLVVLFLEQPEFIQDNYKTKSCHLSKIYTSSQNQQIGRICHLTENLFTSVLSSTSCTPLNSPVIRLKRLMCWRNKPTTKKQKYMDTEITKNVKAVLIVISCVCRRCLQILLKKHQERY